MCAFRRVPACASMGFTLLLMAALCSRPAIAELDVRECINRPATSGIAWRLPADAQWYDLGFLEFNNNEPSDLVVIASAGLHEDTASGLEIEYQVTFDGTPAGWWVKRSSIGVPDTQVFRTLLIGVAAGEHALGLRARNLSGAPAFYSFFWITPLLLPAEEVDALVLESTSLQVSGQWTTVLSWNLTLAALKHIYALAYTEISSGSGAGVIEWRALRDGTAIREGTLGKPPAYRDGLHFSHIDQDVQNGSHSYSVDLRTTGDLQVTVGPRSLALVAVRPVTLLEASVVQAAITADEEWHLLASSPWTFLRASSMGPYGGEGFGGTEFTLQGAYASEGLFRHGLRYFTPGLEFEVGTDHLHGTAGAVAYSALASDWERLGLWGDVPLRLDFAGIGLCSSGSPMQVVQSLTQILVLPDSEGFVAPYVCASEPSLCCAQFTRCTVYECYASGELAETPVGGTECDIVGYDPAAWDHGPIFANGFETGSFGPWSTTEP